MNSVMIFCIFEGFGPDPTILMHAIDQIISTTGTIKTFSFFLKFKTMESYKNEVLSEIYILRINDINIQCPKTNHMLGISGNTDDEKF